MVFAVMALAAAGVILLQGGAAEFDASAGAATVPLSSNVASADDAAMQVGRPVPLPAYLPASVAFGPEIVVEKDGKKKTTGSVILTYYGAEKKAAVRITQAPQSSANPPPANRTMFMINDVSVALLLDADVARYRDGSIAKHAYAEFSSDGISFIIEYFAPTDATAEEMGAELVEIAGSLLPQTTIPLD